MRILLFLIASLSVASTAFSQISGSEENIDLLRSDLIAVQNKIETAFASFEKNPELLFEKGTGLVVEVPAGIDAVTAKLDSQKSLFLKRVESRKADNSISEERRKKSLQLYQGKLEEISEFGRKSIALSKRIYIFVNEDIPRIKNEFNIDCEDYGKNEAKQNLKKSLDKIKGELQRLFIEPKSGLSASQPFRENNVLAFNQKKKSLDISVSEKRVTLPLFAPDKQPSSTPCESCFRLGDGVDIPLCWIPPGEFMMGSPVGEAGRQDNENQVLARIDKGFWMSKTEVTQAQWVAVMKSNPSATTELDHPVNSVSWHDCQQFIVRLPAPGSGWRFALPTEAQWEYACRAGTTTSSPGSLDEIAWHQQNANADLHTVAKKKANAWGLHDMIGNVFEWCRDGYQKQLPGGRNPYITSEVEGRVRRGGSWYYDKIACRSGFRTACSPDMKTSNLGFRVALVLDGM